MSSMPKRSRRSAKRFPKWLDLFLRWWWRLYFFGIALTIFTNTVFALAQKGPGALNDLPSNFSFLLQQAAHLPLLFGGMFAISTSLALGGLALNVWDWLKTIREKARLRQEYLLAMEADKDLQYISLVIDADDAYSLPQDIFQPLTLQFDPIDWIGDVGPNSTSLIRQKAEDVHDLLGRSRTRHLVILGDPGSGKTTVLSHWMRNAVLKAKQRNNDVLPVYIKMRQFAQLLRADKDRAIATYLGLAKYGDLVQEHVLSGDALLFLDGLDEVEQRLRPTVLAWIAGLHLSQKSSAIVIGTRYSDYTREDFPTLELTEWVVQPMDRSTQEDFASKLLPALYTQLPEGKKLRFAAPKLTDFMIEMDDHPHTAVWTGNPLLFSLAAYVFVHDNGQLPPSRVDLYAKSIDALLEKTVMQEMEEPRSRGARELAVRDVIQQVAAETALRLFDMDTFTEGKLGEVLKLQPDALPQSYGTPVMISWIIHSRLVRTLEYAARFEFIHRTFQEYLVAVALAQRLLSQDKELVTTAWDLIHAERFTGEWFQPMRMLAGCLCAPDSSAAPRGRAIALDWLTELIRVATDPTSDARFRALELAVGSLIEIADLSSMEPDVDAQAILLNWAEALLQTASQGEVVQLASLQRLAPDLPRGLARPAVQRLLAALADNSQPAAQMAAAHALSGLGEQVEISSLAVAMQTATDSDVRLAAAQALLALKYRGGRHPGHATLLAALESPDVTLRRLIADALRSANLSAEMLVRRAMNDNDPEVRRIVAAGALSTLGSPEELLSILGQERDQNVVSEILGPVGRLDIPVERITAELGRRPEPLRSMYALRIFEEWDRNGKREQAAQAASTLVRNMHDTSWNMWEAYAKYTNDFDDRLETISVMRRRGAGTESLERASAQILPDQMQNLGYKSTWKHNIVVIVPRMLNVPAGEFLLGGSGSDEKLEPPHNLFLGDYQIAEAPVTVAEWSCALAARARGVQTPKNWTAQVQLPDRPVVGISWVEAKAYIAWLRLATGNNIWRLPTEAEWEKAACWDERTRTSRIYPWGDTQDHRRANVESRALEAVGRFAPFDASPYGCHDMAGNCWEMTSSIYPSDLSEPDEYQPDDRHENPVSTSDRVRRGGSYTNGWGYARASFRREFGIYGHDFSVGFRLAGGTPSDSPRP